MAPPRAVALAQSASSEATVLDVPVVVVGAGLTGLATALWLRRDHGVESLVLEASSSPGGVVRTRVQEGFVFDEGPNSVQLGDPDFEELIEALGLGRERLLAPQSASRRYVLWHGALEAVPTGPLAFVRSPLLSPMAKARIFLDPLVSRTPRGHEPSVAEFVSRRLGREVLDAFVEPLVGGIYAGQPEQLSLPAAFPRLFAMERLGGSLTLGAFRQYRQRGRDRRPRIRGLASFRGGMMTLPRAMVRTLGEERIRTGVTVQSVRQDRPGAWSLEAVDGQGKALRVQARGVILAGSAPASSRLLGAAGAPLDRIPHASVAVVSLGYRRDQVTHALDGFGFLAPRREGLATLGTIFTSTLWPDRCPTGHVALTAFVGGQRWPQLVDHDDAQLVSRVTRELGPLLGIEGEPRLTAVRRARGAIPQYVIGHGQVVDEIHALEQRQPGLFIAGSWRGGIAVWSRVAQGRRLAERVARWSKVGQAISSGGR